MKIKNRKLLVSLSLLTILLVGVAGCGVNTSSTTSSSSIEKKKENNEFKVTEENEEKAKKWLKENTYYNDFDHSDNELTIYCKPNEKTYAFLLALYFDTKDTNDKDYPFELINPTFSLFTNAGQKLSKIVFKTDSSRIEIPAKNSTRTDSTDITLIDITVPQLKSIENSKNLTIIYYGDDGDKVCEINDKKHKKWIDQLKQEIKIGEVFYSLKGTIWDFE